MRLALVPNNRHYWEFIRLLRNDERVKNGFIKSAEISKEDQERYMARYNDNYMVCLVDDRPAGYIGEIEEDIRIAVHPDYQRKGVGTFMLNMFMESSQKCTAKIKIDNEASLKLFRSCGFKLKYYLLEREAPNAQ